jgi:hypothetical protein
LESNRNICVTSLEIDCPKSDSRSAESVSDAPFSRHAILRSFLFSMRSHRIDLASGLLPPMAMDILRPDIKEKRKRQTLLWIGAAVIAVAVLTVIVLRLKPAAPTVDRSTIWTDTVKRGPMVRQVRSGRPAPRFRAKIQSS